VNSLVQSSHVSKSLKIDVPHVQDKGKATTSPFSPSNDSSKSVSSHMHMKDDCSHVISEIQPQGSNQPKAVIKERLPLILASMDFNLCVFMIELLKTVVCIKFWTTSYFLDNVDIYIFLGII
jgi:hypothetical protein